jgi:pimeloyl-ACP methyl ester carboxylesterase
VARLREAGIAAVAVDLPGHGEDRGPFTDLHGDAARVTAVLDSIDDDVVLVGHSYGGAVITEAGVHDRVGHLVYVCAFALDEQESCQHAAVEESAGISHEGRANLGDFLAVTGDGTSTLDGEGAAACLYQDCAPERVRWAAPRLGGQPLENLRQSPDAIAWRVRPSTYAVCTSDLTVHPDLQRILARRCTTTVEWPTGHSPFLARPELVAGLLADLARSGSKAGAPCAGGSR